MPGEVTYPIRTLPLREQLRDRYRVWFFLVLVGVFALAYGLLHRFAHVPADATGALIGAFVGLLPSLRLGTPARMSITAGDRVRIDAWLARHHVRGARGWVPRLPRALYFDSQIVRYADACVVGPRVTLRKLRRLLLANR